MRRPLIALALPVVALGLASCGKTVSVPTPAGTGTAAVAGATSTTSSQPTFTVGQTVSAKQFEQLSEAAARDAGSAHLKMSMMDDAVTADGEISYKGGGQALKMDMSAMGMDMHMIYVDKIAYLKMTMLGDKYVKLDPKGDDELSKSFGSSLGGMSSLNGLGPLGDSVKWTVTKSGPDGTTLTTKLTREALGQLAKAEGKSSSLDGLPAGDITMTSTLDAKNRPEKTVMQVGGKTMMTMTISDWGVPVTITAPPTSQVTTAPKDLDSVGA
ncbi:hypothetical protein [Branchiibius sp. NY16-3462-2]|uniref:hypothetical protein n=1 Tax=Branchiibius sp. NY16-3462-2 TaxID=1807500 RepID=UPI000796C3F2|nr:hypothetical protein [Branchiibius sp. NY16-3462-2]KYH46128.1 hypothetical protein AZH51_10835 [Branchiibius sp. NY16-3462-2]